MNTLLMMLADLEGHCEVEMRHADAEWSAMVTDKKHLISYQASGANAQGALTNAMMKYRTALRSQMH